MVISLLWDATSSTLMASFAFWLSLNFAISADVTIFCKSVSIFFSMSLVSTLLVRSQPPFNCLFHLNYSVLSLFRANTWFCQLLEFNVAYFFLAPVQISRKLAITGKPLQFLADKFLHCSFSGLAHKATINFDKPVINTKKWFGGLQLQLRQL